tara:strand:+ start:255 stop:428 length:174 start_codon:yes stop_codon:yes gene_type:complete
MSNKKKNNPSQGLGDTVSKIIKNITLGKFKADECEPCNERRKKLNEKFPYLQKNKKK